VAATGTAAWWEERASAATRKRPRPDGLTLDRILDAALVVIDREGLDALTVRRLAAELGCGHASLYRHVAGHDEVVVLLVDRVLGGIEVADPGGRPPRAVAEDGLRQYRRALLEHPSLTPAFLRGQLLGPNALAHRERSLRMLLEAGLEPAVAVAAYLTLTHFVISSAVFEASGASRTESERRAMSDHFASLPPDSFPTLVALAPEMYAATPDDEFERGLTALLDHFEAAR
jgi:AcrR family transcriptional regulator